MHSLPVLKECHFQTIEARLENGRKIQSLLFFSKTLIGKTELKNSSNNQSRMCSEEKPLEDEPTISDKEEKETQLLKKSVSFEHLLWLAFGDSFLAGYLLWN